MSLLTPPGPPPTDDPPDTRVYSRDGSHVAYARKGSVVVAEADVPAAQQLASPAEFWQSAWSPSGDRVAYVHEGTKSSGVVPPEHTPVDGDDYTLRRTELRVREVATGTGEPLVRPSGRRWTAFNEGDRLKVLEFSPDGERIFFWRTKPGGHGASLWSVQVDGTGLRRLLPAIDWADWRP